MSLGLTYKQFREQLDDEIMQRYVAHIQIRGLDGDYAVAAVHLDGEVLRLDLGQPEDTDVTEQQQKQGAARFIAALSGGLKRKYQITRTTTETMMVHAESPKEALKHVFDDDAAWGDPDESFEVEEAS